MFEKVTTENRNLSEQLEAAVCLSNDLADLKAELEMQKDLVVVTETSLHSTRFELEQTKKQNVVLTKQLQGR
jgi:hypothetical protein